MERYTDLEQALRDPSLAFVTEDITTLTEWNKLWIIGECKSALFDLRA